MSKKRRKSQPVVMKKQESNTVKVMSSIEATLAQKEYMTVSFKTGRYMSEKDRPRKKVNKRNVDQYM